MAHLGHFAQETVFQANVMCLLWFELPSAALSATVTGRVEPIQSEPKFKTVFSEASGSHNFMVLFLVEF